MTTAMRTRRRTPTSSPRSRPRGGRRLPPAPSPDSAPSSRLQLATFAAHLRLKNTVIVAPTQFAQ